MSKSTVVDISYLHVVGMGDIVSWRGEKYYVVEHNLSSKTNLKVPQGYPKSKVMDKSLPRKAKSLIFRARMSLGQLQGYFVIVPTEELETLLTYDPQKLLEYARSFAKKCGIDLPVDIGQTPDDSLMNAFVDTVERKIYIHPDIFYKQFSHGFAVRDIPLYDSFILVLAHEFGHAVDPDLLVGGATWQQMGDYINQECKKLSGKSLYAEQDIELASELYELSIRHNADLIKFEENAVRFGRQFVPTELLEAYDENADGLLSGYARENEDALQRVRLLRSRVGLFASLDVDMNRPLKE